MAGGFEALGLYDELVHGIRAMDWILPTDVQDEAIPLILGGGDVCVSSETGSGKTAAFCLPIIQCVCETLGQNVLQSTENSSTALGRNMNTPNKRKHENTVPIELNANDMDAAIMLSEDKLECNALESDSWVGIRATHGAKAGKFYFEAEIHGPGVARIGCSTMQGHLELGKDDQGFGYGGTSMKSWDNSFEQYGVRFGDSNVVGCYLDLEDREIFFSVDGASMGKAFDIPLSLSGSTFFPAICLKKCKVSINFGHKEFKYPHTPPFTRGFLSFTQATLGSQVIPYNSREIYVEYDGPRKPLALVLVPTKDLAEQVYNVFINLSKCIGDADVKVSLAIGGSNKESNLKGELEGGIDILVGTVGKVLSLVGAKVLDLSRIRFFIVDEADRVIDNDGANSLTTLFSSIPKGGTGEHRLQVCFFSATLHTPIVRDMTNKICVNPTWIDLKGPDCIPETVHHVLYMLDIERDGTIFLNDPDIKAITDGVHSPTDVQSQMNSISQNIKELKYHVLLGILNKHRMPQAMIFCRTNLDCDNLKLFLSECGKVDESGLKDCANDRYSSCVLAGMKSMDSRRDALQKFKQGKIRFLICTDVAARGIDVSNLPFVINMNLPDDPELYIHRVGRVGRNRCLGLSISIVAPAFAKEKVWYHRCKNRGIGCRNTSLVEKGGCCIWQDESAMLSVIEERLSQRIEVMGAAPIYSLPTNVTEYGKEVKEETYVPSFHLEMLEPKVKELVCMEREAQNMFLQVDSLLFSASF